ncbi:hypothetical protein GGI08_003196 [Coemansia sp. S2]|nr:hypothetical protein H4S03_008307 [Coemansia sp. S3946]KAJ2059653.1 hypothetical protein GGI08_003196 [Coemansia sp. S2]KAJ2350420.1 hypothetical protein GGH92_002322 [Coemansia sp. RSA 2673]
MSSLGNNNTPSPDGYAPPATPQSHVVDLTGVAYAESKEDPELLRLRGGCFICEGIFDCVECIIGTCLGCLFCVCL